MNYIGCDLPRGLISDDIFDSLGIKYNRNLFLHHPDILKRLPQTFVLIKVALAQNSDCYRYVIDKTREVNEYFVDYYPYLIDSIVADPDEVLEIQKYLVNNGYHHLGEIGKQSREICLYAFKVSPACYPFINGKELRQELAYEAVTRHVKNIEHVPLADRDLMDYAISIDPAMIQYDKEQDEATCWNVLMKNPRHISLIRREKITKEMCEYCFSKHATLIAWFPPEYITYDMAHIIASKHPEAIGCIPIKFLNEGICTSYVSSGSYNLLRVPIHLRSRELCALAAKHANRSMPNNLVAYIPREYEDIIMETLRVTKGTCLCYIEKPSEEMKEYAASFQGKNDY